MTRTLLSMRNREVSTCEKCEPGPFNSTIAPAWHAFPPSTVPKFALRYLLHAWFAPLNVSITKSAASKDHACFVFANLTPQRFGLQQLNAGKPQPRSPFFQGGSNRCRLL